MGIVSFSTASIRPGAFAFVMELIPRSERARLMDLVKFKGIVDGSRRSVFIRMRLNWRGIAVANAQESKRSYREALSRKSCFKSRSLTSSQLIHFNLISSCGGIESCQSPNWTSSNDHCLLPLSSHGLKNENCINQDRSQMRK